MSYLEEADKANFNWKGWLLTILIFGAVIAFAAYGSGYFSKSAPPAPAPTPIASDTPPPIPTHIPPTELASGKPDKKAPANQHKK